VFVDLKTIIRSFEYDFKDAFQRPANMVSLVRPEGEKCEFPATAADIWN
jgi:hypothetical protein